MSATVQLLIVALVMLAVMTAGWAWQRQSHNAGIVDALWAGGLGAAAIFIAATGRGAGAPRLALACLAGVWALRLAAHIAARLPEGEDGRYRYLRAHWQGDQGKILGLFLAQALLVVIFSLPFAAVAANPAPAMAGTIGVAVLIWLVAVVGEGLADRQLAAHRADPAMQGRTCRRGLWRYSRHPNYFFEWVHWFVYPVLALGSPLGWLAWSGPVLMYVFLNWVSGIPYTEAQALRSRGEDYRDYQRGTPRFFPGPPKASSRTTETP